MPRIPITYPMVRGHTISKSTVQTTYDDLKTLINTTKLGNLNFADNAGIPEHYVEWDVTSGHDHRDGSLGAAIISDVQLNVAGELGVQWVLAQSPGMKMIAGVSPAFPLWLSDEEAAIGHRVTVVFGQGSDHPTVFDAGTTPMVIANLYDDDNFDYEQTGSDYEKWGDKKMSLTVHDVTSGFFTLRYTTDLTYSLYEELSGDTSYPSDTWRAFYLAIGRAPGYLTNPAGV